MPFRTAVSLAGMVPGIAACRAEPLTGKMFIMGPYTGVDTMSTLHYYSLMNLSNRQRSEIRQEQARLADVYNLRPGDTFSTQDPDGVIGETGCTVVDLSGDYPFSFYGLDSEGYECGFDLRIIAPGSVKHAMEA